MTTRKQKREEAEAKHQRWVEEQRASGLEAQRMDREHREHRLRESQRPKHDKQHSWKKIDANCILCQELLANQRRQQKELEASNSG